LVTPYYAALRSSGLEILGAGSGAMPSMDVLKNVFQRVLADIAAVWNRESRKRLVLVQ
jgi:hypothetical protein